ncbi:MAG: alpha/beta fold hydrolase [Burkholderiales bacterium]
MSTATAIADDATRRTIRVPDGDTAYDIHYNDCGSGDRVVVMLHGSGPGASGWANFHRNVEPLVSRGMRVLLVDCPGWSRSSSVVCTGSRSDLNARITKGVLDALGIGQVDLVGNSMGGHSAVAFALAFPERARRLVLMGGGTGGPSQFVPMPTEGIKLMQQVCREPSLENVKRMMSVFVYDASSLTDELLQMRVDAMHARREHLDNFLKSLAANPKQFPDYGHRLGEIKAPTMIVWGRDDRFVPFDIGLRLLWGIPNADLTLFSRCGHWAQWEHAEKFNTMVVEFLTR